MIWMGVGRPGDFVATLNRFPVYIQQPGLELWISITIHKIVGVYRIVMRLGLYLD